MFSFGNKAATTSTTTNTNPPTLQFGANSNNINNATTNSLNNNNSNTTSINNNTNTTGFGLSQPQNSINNNTTNNTSSSNNNNNIIISQPTPYSTQIADSLTSLQEQILPISSSCKFQQILFNINEQLSNSVLNRPITKNIEDWEMILKRTPEKMIPITLNNLEDEYSRLKLQQTTIIAFRTTINKLYYELYLPANERMLSMKKQIEDMILKIDKLQTKLYKIELKLRYLITSSSIQQENQQHTANSLAIDLKIDQLNNNIQESSNKLISGDCWNKLSMLKKKHEQLKKISESFNIEKEDDNKNSSNNKENNSVDESVLKILKLQQDGIVYLDKVISKDLQESL